VKDMLDIKLFRDNPELVRDSEKKRFRNTDNVEKVIEYDQKWRETLQKLNDLRAERNAISKTFKDLAKEGKTKVDAAKIRSREISAEIEKLEPQAEELTQKRDEFRYQIGNLIHESTPIAQTEEGNSTIRKVGKIPKFSFTPKNHVDLVSTVNGVELDKAAAIAGSRFYYLKNDLVLLNLALMRFAIDTLMEQGYTPYWTPFFIKHEVIKEAAELADFSDQLYKIEGEDLYLIATSEQTLAALHRGEVLDEKSLPRKYCGISSCFRREAGSHGKDTLGIFRVHQFEKVEQFIYCKQEDSWQMHDELIKNAELIYKRLKFPYRVISIASGALNDNASKKYDLEAWFPGSETYRELVSCTNCLDYQARKLNIKYGVVGDPESNKVIHTLNSTAIATERTICCLLENYQQNDGTVQIPDVLLPYMNGKKFIGAK
jgi:seryl-tRNA synthetase